MPRRPSVKQIKTVQLINQGYSTHRAMKEAGYSRSSLKQSYKFKKSPVIQDYYFGTGMVSKLKGKGFTEDYMADKFLEWLEAEKLTKFGKDKDFDIQIKAWKEVKEILKPQEPPNKGIKRKITLEEFITGEEEPQNTQ